MSGKLKELWEFVELVKAYRRVEKAALQHPNDHRLRNEKRDWQRRVDHALIELAGGKAPTLFDGGDGAA